MMMVTVMVMMMMFHPRATIGIRVHRHLLVWLHDRRVTCSLVVTSVRHEWILFVSPRQESRTRRLLSFLGNLWLFGLRYCPFNSNQRLQERLVTGWCFQSLRLDPVNSEYSESTCSPANTRNSRARVTVGHKTRPHGRSI